MLRVKSMIMAVVLVAAPAHATPPDPVSALKGKVTAGRGFAVKEQTALLSKTGAKVLQRELLRLGRRRHGDATAREPGQQDDQLGLGGPVS